MILPRMKALFYDRESENRGEEKKSKGDLPKARLASQLQPTARRAMGDKSRKVRAFFETHFLTEVSKEVTGTMFGVGQSPDEKDRERCWLIRFFVPGRPPNYSRLPQWAPTVSGLIASLFDSPGLP